MASARILTATDHASRLARLREYFEPAASHALLDASEVPILALTLADPSEARAVAAALEAAGARTAQAGAFIATVASRAALAHAREAHPQFVAVWETLERTREHAVSPPMQMRARERVVALHARASVMGILNATPDSFYERVGEGADAALVRARELVAAGADVLDIGGQSYAHWNPRIAADEECARVVPVVTALRAANLEVTLSIDTFKARVAGAALAAGAHIINDCSGLIDPELPEVVAAYDAGLVVMHLKGELNVRTAERYTYRDALGEIVDFLYERTERALRAGVRRDAIIVDPGLEFGKEPQTDLEILDRFGELRALGYPILLASSRKSFIGRIFNRPARELLVPSLATAAIGIAAGARMLRVHDVAETVQLARMMAAIGPDARAALVLADHMPETPGT
jgi:dihydropteroate synthase